MNIQKLLDKTGRKQYVDKQVLETAPTGLKGKLEFFKLDKYISCSELEKEYKNRGLIPATIELLCQYDEADLDVKEWVATQWQDSEGKYCYSAFSRWDDERRVSVSRNDDDWNDDWWFAGLRKIGTLSSETENSALRPLALCPHCNKEIRLMK